MTRKCGCVHNPRYVLFLLFRKCCSLDGERKIFVNDFFVSFPEAAVVPANSRRQHGDYKTRKEKREKGGLMR